MTARVIIRRGAASDIRDAHNWYEQQQPGLGRDFLDAVEACIARIADGPQQYTVVLADVRRALLQRFPYSVNYRVSGQDVRIIAVLHQSRDPRELRRRLSKA